MGLDAKDVSRLGPAAQKQIMAKLLNQNGKGNTPPKESKMHNVKTECCGITFDSKKEAQRYAELMVMLKAGVIKDLRLQHCITITEGYTKPNGERVRPQVYKADFSYINKDGKRVYEDAKGRRTQVYINKKKLVYELHGIEIVEV